MSDDASPAAHASATPVDWLVGGGEMGEVVRAKDWSTTPLGPIDSWPQSLRTAVNLCLSSNFPINIIWGPDHTQIYNDGYRVVCGDVHPRALGENYSVTWASAWPVIGDSFARALSGERMFLENQRMFLKRHNNALEETFFTFSHSPIRDESGKVGGLFHPVTETTGTMLSERRTRALRDLSSSLGSAVDEADVAQRTVDVLARFEFDLPFLVCYALDPTAGHYKLAAHHGIAAGGPATPLAVESDAADPWPFGGALTDLRIVEVENLAPILHGMPCGPYEEPPVQGFVVPVVVPAAERPPAVIITGASSRLPLTADYRSFYDLLGVTISGALATVRAREDERRRAEALAEIDRAKTAFFSNVSHEFRTPLTLMLGPLEDLKRDHVRLSSGQYQQVDLAHRNGLRLLKLVNTLLDFSRIEAGRVQAVYEPTDLAAATSELASVFRSAVEKAGLRLVVDCPPLPEDAYVDREMWEKIVLNLLSNAFKFTFEGQIEIALSAGDQHFELRVSDTGTGIPREELPKLFERFHRVAGAQGRTYEGSGIGLALVQELAKLHRGSVAVDSVYGKGSTFTVTIPRGSAHLPANQIGAARTQASTALGATPFVEEALRWLPDAEGEAEPADEDERIIQDLDLAARNGDTQDKRARILLADDNADMRDYVRRLLASRYEVDLVPDGEAALAAIASRKPDLVLSDIMMPRLDGMQLLARLRSDPVTSTIPVILLSARAGEESRVEGLQAGADDYLIKPFSARELLARVEAHVKMAHYRHVATAALRESEARFRHMADHAPVMIWVTDAAGSCTFLSQSWYDFTGQTPESGLGFGWLDATHPEDRVAAHEAFLAANAKHKPFRLEYRLRRKDGAYRWAIYAAAPRLSDKGDFLGYIGSVIDITERKQSEQTQRLLLAELNHRVKNTLASVQAIVQHTLRRTDDPKTFAENVAGRIQSLARAHSLLSSGSWRGADLHEVIRDQLLQGAVDETRIAVLGPAVRLESQVTMHLALMLHELGTNAVKYGALSVPSGRVSIRWNVEDRTLRLRWEERGGPPAKAPVSRGFGTTLIEQSVKGEGGSARMSVDVGGFAWDISLPLGQPHDDARLMATEIDQAASAPMIYPREVHMSAPFSVVGKRFLIIEDEPLVALDLGEGLREMGAVVVASVAAADQALELIESRKLDAALLDGNLRGTPVDEVAAALTRHGVPFVFVTGYGRENLPRAFRHAALLSKPFSRHELSDAVARLFAPIGDAVSLTSR